MVDNWDFMSLLEINKNRTEELLLQFQFDFSDRDDTNLEKYLLKISSLRLMMRPFCFYIKSKSFFLE